MHYEKVYCSMIKGFLAFTISSPCHSFNRWFGNSQDCDVIFQLLLCVLEWILGVVIFNILVVNFDDFEFLDFQELTLGQFPPSRRI